MQCQHESNVAIQIQMLIKTQKPHWMKATG